MDKNKMNTAARALAILTFVALATGSALAQLAQSPIDIQAADLTIVDNLPALYFNYGTNVALTVVNTGSPDEFATVRQYLTRHYGTVSVNSAPAADLVAVLGLSTKDAEAVVAYRTAHGKFATIDDLRKVPGLEKIKLDDQAEALRFD